MAGIFQKISELIKGPEIAIFHEFHKPPYGGGNTFLLALEQELRKLGKSVGRNRVGQNTKAVLFNSYNFDFEKLKGLKERFSPRMVHRIDGPISIYRGENSDIDRKISGMNNELADATVFQSRYSLEKSAELGLTFKDSSIITNASDPAIFNRQGRASAPQNRKVKLIASSWSNNPKKGGPTLSWLDEHLDHTKYELTFVGRTRSQFKNAKVMSALSSHELAETLKQSDIYIAPSQDDPCSNALIEALTCGLPAVFLKSGGHPELVGEGGEGFTGTEDLISAIEKIARNYEHYQSRIKVLSIEEVAKKYLEVFRI